MLTVAGHVVRAPFRAFNICAKTWRHACTSFMGGRSFHRIWFTRVAYRSNVEGLLYSGTSVLLLELISALLKLLGIMWCCDPDR